MLITKNKKNDISIQVIRNIFAFIFVILNELNIQFWSIVVFRFTMNI